MTKIIKHLSIFLLIFFPGMFLIDIGIENLLIKNSGFRFSRLYYGKIESKIIAIGNSRGVNSIYAPIFKKDYDLDVFNLAYNGLNAELSVVLLEDLLKKDTNVNCILFEISSLFKHKGKSTKIDHFHILYTGCSEQLNSKFCRDHKRSCQVKYLFPIYKYNSEFLLRNMFYFNRSDQEWINNNTINSEVIRKSKDLNVIEFLIDTPGLKALQKFSQNSDLKFIFYVAPYLPEYKAKLSNYNHLMELLKAELDAEILDLSDLIKDYGMFADKVHINKTGAKNIADTLAKTINDYH